MNKSEKRTKSPDPSTDGVFIHYSTIVKTPGVNSTRIWPQDLEMTSPSA